MTIRTRLNKVEKYSPSVEQEHRLNLLLNLVSTLELKNIKYTVMGGYGLDGLYGELTRDHGDIDMLINENDLDKTHRILIGIGFKFQREKNTSGSVYVHTETGTKLEIGSTALLSTYTEGDQSLFLPTESNASLGETPFRTATIEGHRIIQNIQVERAKQFNWDKNPHEDSTRDLMQKIESNER
jgi:hypothetical protein